MKAARLAALSLVLLAIALSLAAPAAAAERGDVAEKYKWNVADLYPSEDAWRAAKDELARRIPELAKFQGRLGESRRHALRGASTPAWTSSATSRGWPSTPACGSDEDTRDQQAPRDEPGRRSSSAWTSAPPSPTCGPRSSPSGAAKVKRLRRRRARGSRPTAMFLDDILRCAPHTLSAAEEKIVAQAGDLADAGGVDPRRLHQRRVALPRRSRCRPARRCASTPPAYTQYRASCRTAPTATAGLPGVLRRPTRASSAPTAPRSTRSVQGARLRARRCASSTAASRPRCSATTSRRRSTRS